MIAFSFDRKQRWLFQVQEHVRFNCLKLLVISSDKERSNKMPSPSSLAWDYDLVSTRTAQPLGAPHWAALSRTWQSAVPR